MLDDLGVLEDDDVACVETVGMIEQVVGGHSEGLVPKFAFDCHYSGWAATNKIISQG